MLRQECLSLPRRGWIPQPRVAQRTLGGERGTVPRNPDRVRSGIDTRPGRSNPFRVAARAGLIPPGCAARPWAVGSNHCGVAVLLPTELSKNRARSFSGRMECTSDHCGRRRERCPEPYSRMASSVRSNRCPGVGRGNRIASRGSSFRAPSRKPRGPVRPVDPRGGGSRGPDCSGG